MVEVKFRLTRRDFAWIGLVIVLVGIGFGYAYGGGDPAVMGHSAGELEVADSNAITLCPNNKFLDGDGSCLTSSEIVSAGGGASGYSFVYYCFLNSGWGTPVCNDAGGTQKYCPAGYVQEKALGQWGSCYSDVCGNHAHRSGDFLPPGGTCGTTYKCTYIQGRAYICSQ